MINQFSFKNTVAFALSIFLSSCTPPGSEPPPQVSSVRIALVHHVDPYIVTGKPFVIAAIIDLESTTLGEFSFNINYDPSLIEPDPGVPQWIAAGTDGFFSGMEEVQPGSVRVSGSGGMVSGPEKSIELLFFYFQSRAEGECDLALSGLEFFMTDGNPIEQQVSADRHIVIGPPTNHQVSGRVVDSIGGSVVEGASVTIADTAFSATTGADGCFEFDNVPIGVYDLFVTKPGMAGSSLERVHVAPGAPPVEMMLAEYAYLPSAITPPVISIRGLWSGETYDGIVPVRVVATAGSCPVIANGFHAAVFLRAGLATMNYYDAVTSSDGELSYEWNTQTFPGGPVFIKIVAYDSNNNRAELNVPVNIASGTGSLPSVAPEEDYFAIIANTYGNSLGIMRGASSFYNAGANPIGDATLKSRTIIPDTTVLVEIQARKFYNGLAIYRSDALDGVYGLVGHAALTEFDDYRFVDYSPALEPDSVVYYRLAYYNRYGTGPQTAAIPLRILPKYRLDLVSPANNATISDTAPLLTWKTSTVIPGARRTDWIIATNTLDASIIAYTFAGDTTSHQLSGLLSNCVYEWDVRSFYEYQNNEDNPNILSRSYPRGRGSYDFSSNGAFTFTVVQQD